MSAIITKIDIVCKRGEIWLADLNSNAGNEQGGIRPVLIIQNNIGNRFSPTVICAVLTSKPKKHLPTHVYLKAGEYNLDRDSVVLLEQVKTIDKYCLITKLAELDEYKMREIDQALKISLGLE